MIEARHVYDSFLEGTQWILPNLQVKEIDNQIVYKYMKPVHEKQQLDIVIISIRKYRR